VTLRAKLGLLYRLPLEPLALPSGLPQPELRQSVETKL
jgi:hypothetical protein